MQWRGPRRGWSWSVTTSGRMIYGRVASRRGARDAIRDARLELNRPHDSSGEQALAPDDVDGGAAGT